MANRPLTAWLLSIVIAMGVCLPAPALASDMPQGGFAIEDRASAQEYEVVDLSAGASKETIYLKNNSGYAYRIVVAKAGAVRFDYTWTLPCGHNYFAVSIVNSKGEEVVADSVYHSYVQKDCTLSRTVNLEPGEYRIEVTYRAGHQGKEGSFTARYTADAPYSDVPEGSWYRDAVLEVSAMGLMAGYGDGTFGPSDSLTRAQAATIL